MSKSRSVSSVLKLTFDPRRDIAAVVPYGFIDLVGANNASSVPSSVVSEDSKFNGIEHPGAVAGRPRDVFEHAQGSRVIQGYTPPEKDSDTE